MNHLNDLDIHRLKSGQVIIDLPSIVKELIENSLDANATSIEIVLTNYGLGSIEIIDNGNGIDSKDFENLCLIHNTSKISNFDDLNNNNLSTFGFRGEALSSICSNCGTLSIKTTPTPPKAHLLKFNPQGKLTDKSVISHNRGTSVLIQDIFHNLPVRLKLLQKTIKREFNKVLQMINQYVIISKGVKFVVKNVVKKQVNNILQTQGSLNLKDNLINVFGSNVMFGLIDIDLSLHLNNYDIVIKGYVSKPSFGFGRSINDRQFIFVNNRPISNNKLNRLVNEIYKTFNNHQFPSFILNFDIDNEHLDLNVTPDKKIILFHDEELIHSHLRDDLINFFESLDITIPKNNLIQNGIEKFVNKDVADDDQKEEEEEEEDIPRFNKKRKIDPQSSPKEQSIDISTYDRTSNRHSARSLDTSSFKNSSFATPRSKQDSIEIETEPIIVQVGNERFDYKGRMKRDKLSIVCYCGRDDDHEDHDEAGSEEDQEDQDDEEEQEEEAGEEKEEEVGEGEEEEQHDLISKSALKSQEKQGLELEESLDEDKQEEEQVDDSHTTLFVEEEDNTDYIKQESDLYDGETQVTIPHESARLDKSHDTSVHVKNYDVTIPMVNEFSKSSQIGNENISTSVQIDDITNEDESEDYLTLTVSKQDFNEMKIIGQFNLGFILVIRNSKDLFIVDQHASDEKFNFETLQKTTIFQNQRLFKPIKLDLNKLDEMVVLENQEIFRKNGFNIETSEDDDTIVLKSLPFSQKTIFDVSDFNELIHLIKENPTNLDIKCSKIRSMFAMRACRKSIMVGKNLNHSKMTKVVRNLGTLSKPWNCPHGRPTMRHLMELKQWETFTKDYEI